MKLKKLLSVFVSLALLLSLISVPVFADGNNVAQIGDTEYATLADAIAAVPTDGTQTTITMIANETIENVGQVGLTVAANKNIVLDLNGKTISGVSSLKSTRFIDNKGTLEITDSSANEDGKITFCAVADTGYSVENITIYNIGGKLTLIKGTIENTTAGGLTYAVNTSSNAWGTGDDKYSEFTMTGGRLAGANTDNTLRVYQNCAAGDVASHNTVSISGGVIDNGIFVDTYLYTKNINVTNYTGANIDTEINISGGTVNGLIDLKIRHPFNTVLNITGGDFTNAKLQVRKHGEYNTNFSEPTEPMVNIAGGCFAFANAGKAFLMAYDSTNSSWSTYEKAYEITGGKYSVDPSAYVTEGYSVVDNTDDDAATYPYVIGEAVTYVAKIGNVKYASLEEALAAAPAGATVELLADIDYSTVYTERNARDYDREHAIDLKDCTLDMNGYTISTINATVVFGGNGATIENGTFNLVPKNTDGSYKDGSYALIIDNAALGYNADDAVTVNDVVCNGGVNVDAATVELNNVTASTTPTKFYTVWAEENANVTVNSGVYADTVDKGKGVFHTDGAALISVNGGTFTVGNKIKYSTNDGTVVLYGGTYNKVPTAYVATGYEAVDNNNGTWTVKSSYDAQIGDVKYDTLEAAVEAANAGDTIVLLNDITYGEDYVVAVWEKDFNLDLNGHTFTTNSIQSITAGNNGYKATAICYGDTVVANPHRDISINNGTIRTAYGAGIYADGDVTMTLSGLDVKQNYPTNVQTTDEYSSAIRLTTNATVIVEDGSYAGKNAIAVSNSGGNVIVNGGTFKGDLFFSTGTSAGAVKSITINGGNFTNVSFENTDKGTLTIYGGTFDNDPTAYVATGYEAVDNNNGTWTVGKVKVGELTQTETNEGFDATYTVTKQVVDSDDGVIDVDAASRTVNVKLVDTIVSDDKAIASENNSIDNIKVEEVLGEAVADTSATDNINVEIQVVRDKPDLDTTNNTITYEVHPEAVVYVNGVETKTVAISNDALADNADITITLPVPDALAALAVNGKIRVIHRSEGSEPEVLFYEVQQDLAGNHFIQFNVSHFSEFELGLPLFTGHSISLNGYVDLNFFLNLSEAQVTTGTGTVVDFTWARGSTSYQIKTTDFVEGKGYKATVKLPAAEMNYMINAKVTINGALQTETNNYSVREYCDEILDPVSAFSVAYVGAYGTDKYYSLVYLVKTMLDYGAKAQVAFGRTDVALANAGVDYTMPNASRNDLLDAIDTTIYNANGRYADNMLTVASNIGANGYYSSSLIYLSGCTLRHYFVGPGLDASKYTGVKAGYYYYVDKANIAAADLDTLQAFQVGDDETFYYSALDFAKAIIYNYAEGSNYDLAAATYWYNQAANAYFE